MKKNMGVYAVVAVASLFIFASCTKQASVPQLAKTGSSTAKLNGATPASAPSSSPSSAPESGQGHHCGHGHHNGG